MNSVLLQLAVDRDNNIVGMIETFDSDRKNGTFDYYLAVFESYRGKGYAKEMILMVLRFFFWELAYQKVNTTVYSFNDPSMRLHEKLGFMKEGQLRNIIFTKGSYYDGNCYGMTREEFEMNHAEKKSRKDMSSVARLDRVGNANAEYLNEDGEIVDPLKKEK